MDKRLAVLNVVFAVTDTLVCLSSLVVFAYAAVTFSMWWVTLFSLVPVLLYYSHTMIINDELPLEGSEEDGK